MPCPRRKAAALPTSTAPRLRRYLRWDGQLRVVQKGALQVAPSLPAGLRHGQAC